MKTPRIGFTLVELLVVVAIIGVLVALLLPAIQASRESSRRTRCANNLKQMGTAGQAYHNQFHVFPASWVNGDESITWGRSLLPFLEEQSLADAWDKKIGWLAGKNADLVATPIAVYKCPTAPSPTVYEFEQTGWPLRYGTVDYKGCDGANASDPVVAHWQKHKGWDAQSVVGRRHIAASRITDGLSNTILLVESVGGKDLFGPGGDPNTPPAIWYPTDGSWAGRAFSSVSPTQYAKAKKVARCTVNCSNMYDFGPYSFHPGGALCVLCDGAVRWLGEDIDEATLCELYVFDDEQTIQPY